MQVIKFIYWQEGDAWLGYLQDCPDYWAQGETLDDLKQHLKDLHHDLTGGGLPGIRKVGELVVGMKRVDLIKTTAFARIIHNPAVMGGKPGIGGEEG